MIIEIKYKQYARPSDAELNEKLDEVQYNIMVEKGTERPFSSPYHKKQKEGVYVDAATGEPLFTTYDQYETQCGWPSFTAPIKEDNIKTAPDYSHEMERTEVRSAAGDFHLGHVFEDGPAEHGGLRYCINGAAIRFIPKDELEQEGYDYLIPYLNERKRLEEMKEQGKQKNSDNDEDTEFIWIED